MKSRKQALELSREYKVGVKSRWYLGDMILALSSLKIGDFKNAIPLLLPGQTDIYDDICPLDPCATLGQFIYYLYKFLLTRSSNPVEKGMLG